MWLGMHFVADSHVSDMCRIPQFSRMLLIEHRLPSVRGDETGLGKQLRHLAPTSLQRWEREDEIVI